MSIALRVISRLKEFSFLLFAKVRYGNNFLCGKNVRFHKGTSFFMDDKSRFSVGNNFFARDYMYIRIENGDVEIGDNVFFNNFCSVNSVGGGLWLGIIAFLERMSASMTTITIIWMKLGL